MNYSRSKTRSLAGMISDRHADSLEAIVAIGDVTEDVDNFCRYVKERDGYRVLEISRVERRFGCTEAVVSMCEALGARAVPVCDPSRAGTKRRIIVNNEVLCRIDQEKQAFPIRFLHPAKVVLVVDYAKGAIDAETMQLIGQKYAGKEVIADWHHDRPLEFYASATAIKSSWCGPPEGETRPFVWTQGSRGMSLYLDGEETNWPAMCFPPLDCCGAGDSVLAALGVGRLRGWDWLKCCQFASEVAAEVCGVWGSVYVPSDVCREL